MKISFKAAEGADPCHFADSYFRTVAREALEPYGERVADLARSLSIPADGVDLQGAEVCFLLEAGASGLERVVVKGQAATTEQAICFAVGKLDRYLAGALGKQSIHRKTGRLGIDERQPAVA